MCGAVVGHTEWQRRCDCSPCYQWPLHGLHKEFKQARINKHSARNATQQVYCLQYLHILTRHTNGLPYSLPHSVSQATFRRALKPHLFQQSFWPSTLVSLMYFPQYEFLCMCLYVHACVLVCVYVCVCGVWAHVCWLISQVKIWCCKCLMMTCTSTVWAQRNSPLPSLLLL